MFYVLFAKENVLVRPLMFIDGSKYDNYTLSNLLLNFPYIEIRGEILSNCFEGVFNEYGE